MRVPCETYTESACDSCSDCENHEYSTWWKEMMMVCWAVELLKSYVEYIDKLPRVWHGGRGKQPQWASPAAAAVPRAGGSYLNILVSNQCRFKSEV